MKLRSGRRAFVWSVSAALLLAACDSDPELFAVDVTDRLVAYQYFEGRISPAFAEARLGGGWHRPEKGRRWTSAQTAVLRVPMRDAGTGRVIVRASAPGLLTRQLTVSVNGFVLGVANIGPGKNVAEYDLADGVVKDGLNELLLNCDQTGRFQGRELGVFVEEVIVEPGVAAGNPLPGPLPVDGHLLGPGRWIEDPVGILGVAPLELEWSSPDSISPVSDTLELLRTDPVTAELILVAECRIEGIRGTAILKPDAESLGPHSLRLRGDSEIAYIARQRHPRRPDIVMIVVDTWRSDHLGSVRPDLVQTPELDELEGEGVRFSRAFSHIPITGPSHASLFTGRLPSEAGVLNNHTDRLDPELPTLAAVLGAYGYDTRATVSIDPIHGRLGFASGFGSYRSKLGAGGIISAEEVLAQSAPDLLAAPNDSTPRFDFIHFSEPHEPYDAHGLARSRARLKLNGDQLAEIPISDYTPRTLDVLLRAGENQLWVDADSPFRIRRLRVEAKPAQGASVREALEAGLYSGPAVFTIDATTAGKARLLVCLDDYDGGLDEIRRRYALEVEAVDEAIGVILQRVKSRGKWDDTLVIVTSDHGEALGWFDHVGHVEALYDRYVHIPLIVKPPRSWAWKPGRVRDDLVALSDLMPSVTGKLGMLSAAGLTGRNVFDRSRRRGERIFLETHAPQSRRTRFALRDERSKLIWTPVDDAWEFYDLVRDPDEQENHL